MNLRVGAFHGDVNCPEQGRTMRASLVRNLHSNPKGIFGKEQSIGEDWSLFTLGGGHGTVELARTLHQRVAGPVQRRKSDSQGATENGEDRLVGRVEERI